MAYVHAGAGDDRVESGTGNDQIFGGDGNDMLFGNGGEDHLRGGSGDDYIDGGNGDDIILGDDGNDKLAGGRGDDRLNGGQGSDSVNGGDGDDLLSGGAGTDTLNGGAGNDSLYNSGIDGDILIGGDGNDTFSAGSEDFFYSGWWFEMHGGAGDDHFDIYSDGAIGTIDGGEGFDRLSFDFDDVSFGFSFDAAEYSTIEEFDISVRAADKGAQVSGGAGNDRLVSYETYKEAPSGNDIYNGRAGDDVIHGSFGTDSLLGGEGNDSINGGHDSDRLLGGSGSDMLTGGPDADTFIWDEASVRGGGLDRITDFNPQDGDVLLFRGDTIDDFDSILAASHDTAEGVYVRFDGDTNGILIEGIALADLSADDVVFA